MKHTMKLLGTRSRRLCVVVLVVVFGFVMASCSLLGDESPVTLSGMYWLRYSSDGTLMGPYIQFSGSDFTQVYRFEDEEYSGSTFTGTYSISGRRNLRLEYSGGETEVWRIVDQDTLQDDNDMHWRK